MKTYKVSVREEIYTTVYIDATDQQKAEDAAYDLYRDIDHSWCVDIYRDRRIQLDCQYLLILDDETEEVSGEKSNLLTKNV